MNTNDLLEQEEYLFMEGGDMTEQCDKVVVVSVLQNLIEQMMDMYDDGGYTIKDCINTASLILAKELGQNTNAKPNNERTHE